MKVIVGLGNPGPTYARTRHNAGFMALDRVAGRLGGGGSGLTGASGPMVRQRFSAEVLEGSIDGEKVLFMKPMRFMNCSGSSVGEAVGFYKVDPTSDLLVLVDDYALPLGSIRVRAEGSPGGHNGLTDIERVLGHSRYPRLRIGIGAPPPGFGDPADWVLGRFTDDEARLLEPALEACGEAVRVFVREGVVTAMNRFNARPRPSAPAGPTGEVPVREGGRGVGGVGGVGRDGVGSSESKPPVTGEQKG